MLRDHTHTHTHRSCGAHRQHGSRSTLLTTCLYKGAILRSSFLRMYWSINFLNLGNAHAPRETSCDEAASGLKGAPVVAGRLPRWPSVQLSPWSFTGGVANGVVRRVVRRVVNARSDLDESSAGNARDDPSPRRWTARALPSPCGQPWRLRPRRLAQNARAFCGIASSDERRNRSAAPQLRPNARRLGARARPRRPASRGAPPQAPPSHPEWHPCSARYTKGSAFDTSDAHNKARLGQALDRRPAAPLQLKQTMTATPIAAVRTADQGWPGRTRRPSNKATQSRVFPMHLLRC